MVSAFLMIVKSWKVCIYALLALILGCNIYGVETVFGFFIPDITITPDKEDDVKFFIDESILKYTFYAVILEVIDNILSLSPSSNR